MKIPAFVSKQELYTFLKANKSTLIAQKKYTIKYGDVVSHSTLAEDGIKFADKIKVIKSLDVSSSPDNLIKDLKAVLVINTTNIMDSHCDVHIPGIWNKTLKENKNIYLLQEHQMTFPGIISSDVQASVKTMPWKELGYKAEGDTQALIFTTLIPVDRNTYMAEQYAKGNVTNHSVGMQYVDIALAINSESKNDAEEKKIWDKYINSIVNRDAVEELGYFWAVREAKLVEGSAVPIGSNKVTPVLSITDKYEPSTDTQKDNEPANATRKLDYDFLIKNLKIN